MLQRGKTINTFSLKYANLQILRQIRNNLSFLQNQETLERNEMKEHFVLIGIHTLRSCRANSIKYFRSVRFRLRLTLNSTTEGVREMK